MAVESRASLLTQKMPSGSPAFKSGRVDGVFLIDREGISHQDRTGYEAGLLPSNVEIVLLFSELADA
ncbi:MAG: hypothetical protein CL878_10045 [Dehalococcoidia bacterium]|nr:hypothetical protein [Dehalococcoidia bacterium]